MHATASATPPFRYLKKQDETGKAGSRSGRCGGTDGSNDRRKTAATAIAAGAVTTEHTTVRAEDNRIAFGGRGAPHMFGSKIDPKTELDKTAHDLIGSTRTWSICHGSASDGGSGNQDRCAGWESAPAAGS